MRILITGATSMIGLALTKKLIEGGHNIVAVIRENSSKRMLLPESSRIKVVECSMSRYGRLGKMVDADIDVAFLAAWNGTRGDDRNNHEMQENNYRYCVELLPQLKLLGCKKIVTAGSQAEYGPWMVERKLSEEDEAKPNTEYGKYKLAFYEYAKEYCQENRMQLVEPRIFSIYGPDDYEGTMVISMLRNMLADADCNLTQCIQKWNFLYIDDGIIALQKLIDDNKASGIYNLGTEKTHELKWFVEQMYRITGSESKLNYGAVAYPTTGMVNVNPDVRKLLALGWKPRVSFAEGIKRIVEKLHRR